MLSKSFLNNIFCRWILHIKESEEYIKELEDPIKELEEYHLTSSIMSN